MSMTDIVNIIDIVDIINIIDADGVDLRRSVLVAGVFRRVRPCSADLASRCREG